jgi:hypothetical protein
MRRKWVPTQEQTQTPVAPEGDDKWRPDKVKLAMLDGKFTMMNAVRHGGLIVHRLPAMTRPDCDGANYGLSHYPTGLLILWTEEEADAKRIGQFLWGRQAGAFKEEDPKEVTKRMAGWVVPWVRECRRQRKWVDPTLFLQEERRRQ